MWEHQRHGAVDIVAGETPLTLESSPALRDVLEGLVTHGQPQLVLDCRRIPLMDSAGLELLMDTRDRCVRRGGQIHLAAVNPLCLDILKVTQLARHFEVFGDSVAAAGSFAQ